MDSSLVLMHEDSSGSKSLPAQELQAIQSERQKSQLRDIMHARPHVKPLAEALLARLDQYHSLHPSTPPKWMMRATTILTVGIVNILLAPGQEILPWSMTRSSYTLSPKASHFMESFKPLINGQGWVDVVGTALKLVRQDRDSRQPSTSQVPHSLVLHSPQNLQPDASRAIKSLFLNTTNLLQKTGLETILLNINFAAIHVALLQAGIIEYKPSFEAFKKDVEACFKHTNFDWSTFDAFKDLYKTGITFQLPLHLALAISPIMLLRKTTIYTHTVARALGPNAPVLLQHINSAMWMKLMNIAQGTKTARGLLYELSTEFSEKDLQSVSEVDSQFFFPDPPSVAHTPLAIIQAQASVPPPDIENMVSSTNTKPPATPAVADSTSPALSKFLGLGGSVNDFNSDQFAASLAKALNDAEADNAQATLDAGESLPPKLIHPKKGQSEISSDGDITMADESHTCTKAMSLAENSLEGDITMADESHTCTKAMSLAENSLEGDITMADECTKASSTQKSSEPEQATGEVPVNGKSRVIVQSKEVKDAPTSKKRKDHPEELDKEAPKSVCLTTSSSSSTKSSHVSNIHTRRSARVAANAVSTASNKIKSTPGSRKPKPRKSMPKASVNTRRTKKSFKVEQETSTMEVSEETTASDEVPLFERSTDRPLLTGKQIKFYDYDFKSHIELSPKAYTQGKLKQLHDVWQRVLNTAEADGRCSGGLPSSTWAPSPEDPVREIPLEDWNHYPLASRNAVVGSQLVVLRCGNKDLSSPPLTADFIRENLGHLFVVKTLHDSSLEKEADESDDDDSDADEDELDADNHQSRQSLDLHPVHATHCRGTFRDLYYCVVTPNGKIVNFLDNRVSPDKAVPPAGIATDSEAEQGLDAAIAWKRWGLGATTWAIHSGHLEVFGTATYVRNLRGLKLWIAGIPRNADDLGDLEAFGKGYRVDMRNSQGWRIVAVLLRAGDTLIMPPCIPHYVVTLDHSICVGGHFYSSRTMSQTGYGIFPTFVAADFLTNTYHIEAPRSLQHILKFWKNTLCDDFKGYDELLKEAIDRGMCSHIIPHLPNLTILDDVVGLLMLLNLIQLGSILDYRRYTADDNIDIQDDEQFIPPRDRDNYAEAKAHAIRLHSWLFKKVQLCLEGNVDDGLEPSTRLETLSNRWLYEQCRCLIIHKLEAEQLDYKGAHSMVTAEAIKAALEEDFASDGNFMEHWPAPVDGSVEDWVDTWKDTGKSYSYAFPLPPSGGKYVVALI
ncbi:hypothetical protein BT96DRAFT_996074 [Gymnopus androsaceus JB14]|uniref:JmjC domain-containing protein n=1 Tax=Gymnopus androsaceus JB14 TaxID=1447944 RepID=A0A6A4HF87_9AGAR|nr:hypothetical protein BT96DRAFT_996074 [Gymnopus androsaceus JB14]